jgi:hypothetical protein
MSWPSEPTKGNPFASKRSKNNLCCEIKFEKKKNPHSQDRKPSGETTTLKVDCQGRQLSLSILTV